MVEILLSSLCMKKDFQKELDDKIIAIDLIKKEMNEAKTREEHRLPFLSKKPKQIRSVLHQNEFCIFSFQQMNADFRRKHEKTPPRRWRVWFRSVDISRGFLFKGHSKIVHLSTTAVLKALFT